MNLSIGVDGGGTKTELVLVDADGRTLATHIGPGCNPSLLGPEKARATLTEALDTLVSRADIPDAKWKITRTLLCVAGNRDFWRETAATLKGFGTVTTVDDSRPVLELATGGQPGLVLHAGTGSFVAARAPDGSIHYVGGLGWKLGDPGSGFDLGRRAIGIAMIELQRGATDLSPLARALQAHTRLEDYSANSRFFYNDATANAVIAAFALRVIELAETGCGPARQVIADSVTDFARQADEVIHRLFPQPAGRLPCGVCGRILNSQPAVIALRSLAEKLNWPVELRFIETTPIEGVRRLLLRGP
jgi:N-acetylglucosamine kinase-like BadF-type ATPase